MKFMDGFLVSSDRTRNGTTLRYTNIKAYRIIITTLNSMSTFEKEEPLQVDAPGYLFAAFFHRDIAEI